MPTVLAGMVDKHTCIGAKDWARSQKLRPPYTTKAVASLTELPLNPIRQTISMSGSYGG